jgi:hypothetical protein
MSTIGSRQRRVACENVSECPVNIGKRVDAGEYPYNVWFLCFAQECHRASAGVAKHTAEPDDKSRND